MSEQQYQPRYLAYVRAHGLSPEAMLARDREKYPGGSMVGYILWIGEQWRAWQQERGMSDREFEHRTAAHHDDFDAWLASPPSPAHTQEQKR